ncbi:helicase-primase subunit [macacine betaherpesvirus 9]|uniref:Helicase-primase subunit n=1 Tax=macacine betaherpesvirus 9 TaxID=2560568 RepID=A0A191S3T3_9BETA|nr:helicase-primase subunit [macacine betaherpesvirus 9]ANC96533.1 helicase-primase subunit [macacine betaherpesvirus 9]
MEMHGCVCHLSLYCIYNNWKKKIYRLPIFQCLFLNTKTYSLHTFLITGKPISRDLVEKISVTKENIFLWNLNDQKLNVDKKTQGICSLLLENHDLIKKLSVPFILVTISLDSNGYEIIDVRIDAHTVAHVPELKPLILKCTGNYSPIESDRLIDTECTQSTKKMRFGYHIINFFFSLNFCGKKEIFSSSESTDEINRKFGEFFQVDTYDFMNEKFLLITPRNFCAVLYDEDVCLLLIQTTIKFLYTRVFENKLVLLQHHDYIGPDLWPCGNDREIYFLGFPNLWFLSISDLENTTPCVENVYNRIRLFCGLPNSLGPNGHQDISNLCIDLCDQSENLDILKFFKCNSQIVQVESMENMDIYMFFSEHNMFIVYLEDILQLLLQQYVPGNLLPRFNDHYVTSENLLNFILRLSDKSKPLFNRITHELTSFLNSFLYACQLMDLQWAFVQDMCIIHLVCSKHNPEEIIPLLQTGINSCWNKINSVKNITTKIQYIPFYNFMYNSNCFLTSSKIKHIENHWSVTASKCLYNCFTANKLLIDFQNIYVNFQQMIKTFVSSRYEVQYWIDTFKPANHTLEIHEGLLDCNKYTGVWSYNNRLIRQFMNSPLSDEIDFTWYIKCVMSVLKKWIVTFFNESEYAETVKLERKIIFEHSHLFNIN